MRRIIYAMAGVWGALIVASFLVFQIVEPTGDGFANDLNRLSSFLTWQAAAFVFAIVLALVTRQAVARGVVQVKLAGYVPLAASLFLIGSLIAIIAIRVFVEPLFK